MRRNKLIKGIASVLLCSIGMSQGVLAAPPTATVDETLYVNLDYYGEIELANVVKTYTLNGNQTITDEGEYTKITNMTDMTKPVMTENGVEWRFNNPLQRFYFEGKMEKVELPWLFDVSYELNGVPTKAEDLAGAEGYVEIIINIAPNPNAHDYYLENMMLQVAATFNMDKCLSIEAEGAQIQTLGSSKMVMFMALPGETQTFKIGVGTNSFESGGVSMMMAPAKMQQLEMISGIASQIPNVEAAAGAMNKSMDTILDSIGSLQGALDSTKEGIAQIYNGMQSSGEQIPVVATTHEALMNELKNLLATMDEAIPQLDIAQTLLDKAYEHGNNLLEIVGRTENDINGLKRAINTLEDVLDSIEEMGEELQQVENQVTGETLLKYMASVQQQIVQVHNQFYALGSSIESFQQIIEDIQGLLGGDVLGSVSWALSDASQLMNGLAKLMGELDTGLGLMEDIMMQMKTYQGILQEYSHVGKDGFESIQDVVKEMGDLLAHILELQEELTGIGDTMNSYHEPLTTFLGTTQTLATTIRNVLDIGLTQVENIEGIIQEEGPKLNEGMQGTLQGMLNTLDTAGNSLSALQSIKKEKDVITNIIGEGWQQITQNTNLLKINPNAPIQSITSPTNQAPETLQIVVRTKEISKPTQPIEEDKQEEVIKKESLWDKIKKVCKTIVDEVKGILNKVFGA